MASFFNGRRELSSLADKKSSHTPESGGDEPVPEPVVSGESLK